MKNLELAAIKKAFTEFLVLDLEGTTREEVFMNIAVFAKDSGLVKDVSTVCERFMEHERMRSTAIGSGIMVAEAYGIEMSRSYAFILCRTRLGMDFHTPDGASVRIIVATLVRDKKNLARLGPMSRIVQALRSNVFRSEFLEAKDVRDAYQALRRTTGKSSA